MKNEKIIVIYGAGRYGKQLYNIISSLGLNVQCFVQTKKDATVSINGIKVISIDELLSMNENIVILYAIKNINLFYELMENTFKNHNNIEIINCISFIEENENITDKRSLSGKKKCIICNNYFDNFLPGGTKGEIYEKYHIIGGGYRDNCICPCCHSGDRERWVYNVLTKELNISAVEGRVLHFAPERRICSLLNKNMSIDYYTGDIVKGRAMHVTDITNIQYANNSMDIIICNHVLEHIVEIEQAIREIKRVLKENGLFIFSFPICPDIDTLEDKVIVSPKDRFINYGQEDHVRLYGKDFIKIYSAYGFELKIYTPKEMMTKNEITKYGFIEDDILVIAKNVKK